MSNQIVISSGAKVRNLEGVLTGTSGVVNSLGINVPDGIPQLDGSGKILVSQLPNSVMEFKGTWNAATNTPTLVNGVGNAGDVYLVNVAGTHDFGAGPIEFFIGDQVLYSGTTWERASGSTGTVTSVSVTETGDALTITGSPITTSGTINIGFAGTTGQYVNGAGGLTTFPSLTGYVPYTGATGNVNLGEYGLNTGYVGFDLTPTGTPAGLGTLSWDSFYRTLQLIDGTGVTTLQIGQEERTLVHNNTGSTLVDGQVVYITGSTGELPSVALASNTSEATSSVTFGIVTETILNGADGFITTSGVVHGLNTLAFNEGDSLWLGSTAGTFTNIKPIAPLNSVLVGYVIKKAGGNGSIFVKIQNGLELEELHDVLISGVTNNEGLFWDSATSLWKNKSISTALGYTPADAARNLTINGTTYNLTADRTWNVGTVTSVGLSSSTSGVTIGSSPVTTSGTITLAIATASGTQQGLLSSTDWTTFNNKQNALTLTTTGFSGASTLVGATLNVPNYTLAGLGGQPLSTNLTSLSGLTYSSTSFVKMTAAGTFSLDTNTYALASALGNYLPLTGGTLTGPLYLTSGGFTYSIIASGSGFDVASSAAFAPHYITNFTVYQGAIGAGVAAMAINSSRETTFSNTATINADNAYLTLNRSVISKFIGVNYKTAGTEYWFAGLRETSTNNYFIYNAQTASNALTILNSNNNVGLSTSTPSARLSLGVGTGVKFLVYDNPTNGVYSGLGQDLAGGDDINLFAHGYTGTGFISFGRLGTDKTTYTQWARFAPSGNFLLNTTTDAGQKLQVDGTGRFFGTAQPLILESTSNNELVIRRANTANGAGIGLYTNSTHNWLLGTAWGENSSNFIIYNAATGTQSFKINYSTNAATFSSSVTANNGILTSGGTERYLQFAGYNSSYATIRSNVGFNSSYNNISLLLNVNATESGQGNSSIPSWAINLGGNESDSDSFAIARSAAGSYSFSNLFKIKGNGNVGIGTSTPSAKLSTGPYIGMKLLAYDNPAGVFSGIGQDLAAGNSTDFFAHGSGGTGFLTFGQIATNGSTYTEWARFTAGGRFIIGSTTDAGYRFQVANSTHRFSVNPHGGGIDLASTGNLAPHYITTVDFYYGAIGSGSLRLSLSTGGNLTSVGSMNATGFFETSDKRIKKEIIDNPSINGIESIKPKIYIKGDKQEIGYYAQDFEEILPSSVTKGIDGFLTLSYTQVHTAKIAQLEKELAELKELIKTLIK